MKVIERTYSTAEEAHKAALDLVMYHQFGVGEPVMFLSKEEAMDAVLLDDDESLETVKAPAKVNPFKRRINSLEDAGKAELEKLESVIQRGVTAWVDVAEALEQIRDKGLYKLAGFTNFGKYCETRWNTPKNGSYSEIYCLYVYRNLECCDRTLLTKTNCKTLAKLKDKDLQIEVWNKAQTYPKITVKLLQQLVNEYLGKTPKPKTTKAVQLPIEVANQIESAAKELGKSSGELVTALFKKLIDS